VSLPQKGERKGGGKKGKKREKRRTTGKYVPSAATVTCNPAAHQLVRGKERKEKKKRKKRKKKKKKERSVSYHLSARTRRRK